MKRSTTDDIVCIQYDQDVYLMYTKGFTQFYKNGKFVTILGESHNNLYKDQSIEKQSLVHPFDYLQTMIKSNVETLILSEIPPSGDPGIPSYNLENIRRNKDAINNDPGNKTMVLFSDIRQQVFQLPNKTNFYLDIIAKNDSLASLTYEEFNQVTEEVSSFFRWVKEQEAVKGNNKFQGYVDTFLIKIKTLYQTIKGQFGPGFTEDDIKRTWDKNVTITPAIIKMFFEIQQSVLDVNMLYDMYRHYLGYNSFVFVVGENHRLNLNKYFIHDSWDEKSNLVDNSKNSVNLKQTYHPQTLEGCINELFQVSIKKRKK